MAAKQSNNFIYLKLRIFLFLRFCCKKTKKALLQIVQILIIKKFNEIKLYNNPLFLVGPEGDFSDFEN